MPETKITTNEINQTIDTQIVGNTVIASNVQLTGGVADGFPNTTTLYIWNLDSNSSTTQTDVVGGKALTVGAGALTAGADVLGNSKYCAFDGNTYLTCNDAAFNMTETFSISVWAYATDWSPAAANYLVTRASAGTWNGWGLGVLTTGDIYWNTMSAGSDTATQKANINGLSVNAWHHFVVSRTVSGTTNIYVDGVCVSSLASETITAQGNLEVGSENGGSDKFTGRIDELVIYNGTALTADQVRNIYARSAKKFAVKDANSNVKINNNTGVAAYCELATTITATADATLAQRLSIVAPEDGLYLINAQCSAGCTGAGFSILTDVRVGSTSYADDTVVNATVNSDAGTGGIQSVSLTYVGYISRGQSIRYGVGVYRSAAGDTNIYGNDSYKGATNMSVVKVA